MVAELCDQIGLGEVEDRDGAEAKADLLLSSLVVVAMGHQGVDADASLWPRVDQRV